MLVKWYSNSTQRLYRQNSYARAVINLSWIEVRVGHSQSFVSFFDVVIQIEQFCPQFINDPQGGFLTKVLIMKKTKWNLRWRHIDLNITNIF